MGEKVLVKERTEREQVTNGYITRQEA
jgi:hypothetical protein